MDKPSLKNKKLWLVAGVVAAVIIAVLLVAARKRNGQKADRYRTEAITKGDVAMVVTATGTLSAVTTVQVGSQVSGVISRLYADFNSQVKRGQLLAELDPTPFEAQVEQRRADLTRTTRAAKREVNLNPKRRMSKGALVQDEYTCQAASKCRAQVGSGRGELRNPRHLDTRRFLSDRRCGADGNTTSADGCSIISGALRAPRGGGPDQMQARPRGQSASDAFGWVRPPALPSTPIRKRIFKAGSRRSGSTRRSTRPWSAIPS